jgi:hypothetical protein
MRQFLSVIAGACVLATVVPAHAQAPANATTEFDGLWSVTQECAGQGRAKSFVTRYSMTVKNGFARGSMGTEGRPDYKILTGQLRADGSAQLVMNGLTGDPRLSMSNEPAATPYAYTVETQFTGKKGLGHREMARPCTFTFEKQ